MQDDSKRRVAIVDYGLGNLFSVKHACEYVGLEASVTDRADEIRNADAVILPGVGAFGSAMEALRRLDLVEVLRKLADSKMPLIGICLGMQLLMDESFEFGQHPGLGIIPGKVVRFENPMLSDKVLKVPQVSWNRMWKPPSSGGDPWGGTLMEGMEDGVYMYFVHSFYVIPKDFAVTLAVTRYGNVEFCSALRYGRVFAFQCHPERSAAQGLKVYRNLASMLGREG